jgi:hypothetical protein
LAQKKLVEHLCREISVFTPLVRKHVLVADEISAHLVTFLVGFSTASQAQNNRHGLTVSAVGRCFYLKQHT